MATKSRKWRVLKIAGILTGFIVVLLTGVYLLFTYRASQLIEEIVVRESKGKLKTAIGRFRFNYRLGSMEIDHLKVYSVSTIDKSGSYRFSTPKLSLQLKSIWSLLWEKKIDIDAITCLNPKIEVYRSTPGDRKRIVSLPEEIGKIYVSIQDVLNSLHIKRLNIKEGSVQIAGIKGLADPITISRIDLQVDNLRIDTTHLDAQPFLFSDNVILRTTGQDIQWENGDRRLRFKRFYINTKKRQVEIDSCYIAVSKQGPASGSFTILFDSLRLVRPDFKALYLSDNLSVDSIHCINPKLDLEFYIKEKSLGKDSSRLLGNIFRSLTGDLAVKHVEVKNADMKIVMNEGPKSTSFTSKGDNLNLSDVVVSNNKEQPVRIGQMNFAIRNYLTYTHDSLYAIRFDSVHFIKNRLILSRFSIHTSPKARVHTRRAYLIPRFELEDVSWSDLLFRNQLIAKEAVLYSPEIRAEIYKINSLKKNLSLFDLFDIMQENLQINKLLIVDGKIFYKTPAGLSLQLDKINASVDGNHLLEADNIRHIERSINHVDFRLGILRSNNIELLLQNARFNGPSQLLQVNTLKMHNKQQAINLQANDVSVQGVVANDSMITAGAVSWQKAAVRLIINGKNQPQPITQKPDPVLVLNNITGHNTDFELTAGKQRITTFLHLLNAPSFTYKKNNIAAGAGAGISGKDLVLIDEALTIRCGSYTINDASASVLTDVLIRHKADEDSILAYSPKINFLTSVDNMLNEEGALIEYATITDPRLHIYRASDKNKFSILLPGSGADSAGIWLESIHTSPGNWSALVRQARAYDMEIVNIKDTAVSKLRLSAFGLDSLLVSAGNSSDPLELFRTNPKFRISRVSGELSTPGNLFSWKNFSYRNNTRSAAAEKFSYTPRMTREQFVAAHPWQTDYITTSAGPIAINDIDVERYFNDTTFAIRSIELTNPSIEVFRDKRPPFEAGIIKPLPAGMIKKIPARMDVDTIAINNGYVSYTELSPKTLQEGTIYFTRLNARLLPLKNHALQTSDSLNLTAEAYLMDTAWLQLTMREAYSDSLDGFLMNVRMRPTHLSVLNPMLMPAASVKLVSGQLDTLDMRAIGREYLSLGKMEMFYHNLKIAYLKNGDETQKTFATKLISFAINVLLRRKNERRTETIFFVRNRDRSVFNYWVKMTMSGVATSVGARKSRKYDRKYRQELKKLRVPDIGF